jgi:hypothetical protein
MIRRYIQLIAFVQSALLAASGTGVIGEIPPIGVRQGQTYTLQLQAPRTGAATFTSSFEPGYPQPKGPFNLSSSGLLTYSPSTADNFQFRVTLSSLVGGNKDAQTVLVTPAPAKHVQQA